MLRSRKRAGQSRQLFRIDPAIAVSLRVWSETDVSGVIWSNGGHISSSKTEIMQVFLQREAGAKSM